MPLPTPFHRRVSALCETYAWRDWSGYVSPAQYQHSLEREYWAIRNSVGIIDISPLFKYDIIGPDAERLMNRVMTRDFSRCRVGRVYYSPWCDENGDMIHDGNAIRMAPNHFRVTTADPMLRWFTDCAFGMDVSIDDISTRVAALAVQGPKAGLLLGDVVDGIPFADLRYFRLAHGTVDGEPVMVTRTGFTGDLGYELWLDPAQAEMVWDSLMTAGRAYGVQAAGLAALDMVRVEAGLLLIEVDYISALHALVDAQKSSPLEAGLGWAVAFDKGDFVGRHALQRQQNAGPEWALVGLEVTWETLDALWLAEGLRPTVVGRGTSRAPVPVYRAGTAGGVQVGQATSHLFSPLLKKYIALATLKSADATLGATVDLEMTVEYSRVLAAARIVDLPFYNPPHKKRRLS